MSNVAQETIAHRYSRLQVIFERTDLVKLNTNTKHPPHYYGLCKYWIQTATYWLRKEMQLRGCVKVENVY